MELKKLNKKVLDKCIDLTRQFWKDDGVLHEDALTERINEAHKAEVDWCPLVNLLDGILASHGFNSEASNWDIYLILRLLGWEVVDEEIETSESL